MSRSVDDRQPAESVAHDAIRREIRDALLPGRFFVGNSESADLEHRVAQTLRFEIFAGHLLNPGQTRIERRFEIFDLLVARDDETTRGPLISVQFDAGANQLFVTRGMLMRHWEPYEEEPNVILTRETELWSRELVGRIDVSQHPTAASLGRELRELVFQAVVGTSRLPITSVESPLPDYSLGRLAYLPSADAPVDDDLDSDVEQLIRWAAFADLTVRQSTKLVEASLRAAEGNELPRLSELIFQLCCTSAPSEETRDAIFRHLFNEAALSPWTPFGERFVALLVEMSSPSRLGPVPVIDTISFMLRQLVRHLTAFDLETFHNLGANFPDALLLDLLLGAYLSLAERNGELFAPDGEPNTHVRRSRVRRRALRQAWMIRKSYENHPVPDLPTSPGESLRVLPAPFAPVREEQLAQPAKRTRRLFACEPAEELLTPATRAILQQSLVDLRRNSELSELGTALFLDRPLGLFKSPGAADRTPLLSYVAFSRQIAQRRIEQFARWGWLLATDVEAGLARRLEKTDSYGLSVVDLPGASRAGVVTLEDAQRVAADFRISRTTRGSLRELLSGYDLAPLREVAPNVAAWLERGRDVLFVRKSANVDGGASAPNGAQTFTCFDRTMRKRLELSAVPHRSAKIEYGESFGVEHLSAGLRVVGIWDVSERADTPIAGEIGRDIRLVPRRPN